jgi:hypothetical protein
MKSMFVIERQHNNPLVFFYIAADLRVVNAVRRRSDKRLGRDHSTVEGRNLRQRDA